MNRPTLRSIPALALIGLLTLTVSGWSQAPESNPLAAYESLADRAMQSFEAVLKQSNPSFGVNTGSRFVARVGTAPNAYHAVSFDFTADRAYRLEARVSAKPESETTPPELLEVRVITVPEQQPVDASPWVTPFREAFQNAAGVNPADLLPVPVVTVEVGRAPEIKGIHKFMPVVALFILLGGAVMASVMSSKRGYHD